MINRQQTIDRVFILSIVVSLFLHFINRGITFTPSSIYLAILFLFHIRAWLIIRKANTQLPLFISSSTLIIVFTLLKPSGGTPIFCDNGLSSLIKITHLPINYHPSFNNNYVKMLLAIWVASLFTDLLSVFLIKRKS